MRILGAADEISKNVLESPFQELSNNSSTVSVPLQEQNPGRRPGRAFLWYTKYQRVFLLSILTILSIPKQAEVIFESAFLYIRQAHLTANIKII